MCANNLITLCNKNIARVLLSGRLDIFNGSPDDILKTVAAVSSQWSNPIVYCYSILTDGSIVFPLNCPVAKLHLCCRWVALVLLLSGCKCAPGCFFTLELMFFLLLVVFAGLRMLLCSYGVSDSGVGWFLWFLSAFCGICVFLRLNRRPYILFWPAYIFWSSFTGCHRTFGLILSLPWFYIFSTIN